MNWRFWSNKTFTWRKVRTIIPLPTTSSTSPLCARCWPLFRCFAVQVLQLQQYHVIKKLFHLVQLYISNAFYSCKPTSFLRSRLLFTSWNVSANQALHIIFKNKKLEDMIRHILRNQVLRITKLNFALTWPYIFKLISQSTKGAYQLNTHSH